MKNISLARQPIYDRDLSVFAYELLFRNSEANHAEFTNGDDATSQVILSALIEVGLDELVGDKMAFINVTRKFLLGELPFPLGKKKVVLEVLEDIVHDDALIEGIRSLRHVEGYPIALDDFVFEDTKTDLVNVADYIKIDVMELTPQQVEEQVQLLKPYAVKLVAEKVETQAAFDHCKALGFDYFQGYFFCKPKIITGQRTPSSRMAVLQLLSELQDPNLTLQKLDDIIARDVSLSYRILRYTNSAQFGLGQKMDSIKQAIALIGVKTIKAWVTIISLTRFDDKPYELMVTSLVRAKMCELVAQASETSSDSDFVVGLFSLLDALIDKPMAEIVTKLPLSEKVNLALTERQGTLGKLLISVEAFQKGDWEAAAKFGIKSNILQQAFFESIHWANEVTQQLLANPGSR